MDEAGVVDEAGLMDEAWGWFERAAPPCGFCSRMETASSSVGLLLAILHAHARRRPQRRVLKRDCRWWYYITLSRLPCIHR